MKPYWRIVVIAFGGVIGFCAAGTTWFLVGSARTRRLGKQYPPAGAVDMPSPEVFDSAFWTLLGTPFAAVIGGVIGVALAWCLVRILNPRSRL